MKTGTKTILTVFLILSWIIFIGLCIEAGAFITNAVFALVNPNMVPRLWQQVDLTNLFAYDQGQFFVVMLIMSIVAVLKALLFYLVVKILHSKKLDMAHPFNHELKRFIFMASYLCFFIGLFCLYGINYTQWLTKQGVTMPDTHALRVGGADVWLFISVILFVIAQVFKRGIEMQTENELTV